MAETTTARLVVESNQEALQLFGLGDEHLREIQRQFSVRIVARGNEISLTGAREEVERVESLLEELLRVIRSGQELTPHDVRAAVRMVKNRHGRQEPEEPESLLDDVIIVTARGKPIRPKTPGQKAYVDAIRTHGIVFSIGPAGTGKTYLALAVAVAALRARQVSRIVLTRPAVEAGERLGFLPGDLEQKVHPYLRPLYDGLYDILGADTFEKYMSRGVIEVAPLAYMRGRTLDDAFIILDEAQNTTPEQMKMFLTRLGFGSKMVITGDITQVDLPPDRHSGLEVVRNVLRGIEGIAFIYLTERDVVRHPLVQEIIRAYERYEAQRSPRPARGAAAP